MPKTLDFYFDLSSPYSYLAATQLPALAERTGATVRWKPIVLFSVFQAANNTMPANSPPKAQYMYRDLQRWAAEYGVPMVFSSRFPLNTIPAMRLVVATERAGRAGEVSLGLLRALWETDEDCNAPDVQARVLTAAGLDPAAYLPLAGDPAVKAGLKANTDEAIARGAFGAPTFYVDEALFWGNDRLHHVEAALR